MAKIKKLPSGAYRAQPMVNGVRISITDTDRKKVKQLVAQFETMQNNIATKNISVKEAVVMFVQDKDGILSPATIRGYEQISRTYFDCPFGFYKIKKLTTPDVQRFVNDLNRKLAPKTVINIYRLLHAALTYHGVHQRFDVSLPKIPEKVYDVPTNDQLRQLINSADEEMRIAIMLSAFGTMRRSEIAALSSEDIDYSRGVIYINKALVMGADKDWHIKEPKNKSSIRLVPLPEFVLDMIKDKKGRVCTLCPTVITHRFIQLRNSMGCRIRFHDLRHYSASIMHAIGIKDQYIMERGGWKSDHVLKSVYRNTLDDVSAASAQKINSYFAHEFAHEDKEDAEIRDSLWVRDPSHA